MPPAIKLLIVIPSPRDIPEFIQAMHILPWDQYWIKYDRSYVAYPKLRGFFLSHMEYTHIGICPDDMIPTEEGIAMLLKDIEEFGYDVVCGTSNIEENDSRLSLCVDRLPSPDRATRFYESMTAEQRNEILKDRKFIIKVAHAGTPFQIFSRAVMEKLEWRGDGYCNDKLMRNGVQLMDSWAQDVVISNDLAAMGIPIMADLRVFFKHLRHAGELFVGKKSPNWIYVKDGQVTTNQLASYNDLLLHYEKFNREGGFKSMSPNAQAWLENLMDLLKSLSILLVNSSLTKEEEKPH